MDPPDLKNKIALPSHTLSAANKTKALHNKPAGMKKMILTKTQIYGWTYGQTRRHTHGQYHGQIYK